MEKDPSHEMPKSTGQEGLEVTMPEIHDQQGNPDDINEWAIAIQREDGVDVGPEWWGKNVSSEVSIAEQRRQFLEAYERDFPRGEDGERHKL